MESHRSLTAAGHQDGKLHRDDEALSRPHFSKHPLQDAASASPDASVQDVVGASPPAALVPRRNLVLPDPVAFRFLQQDTCVQVVKQRIVLRGYELYLVEQWACSRRYPTLVVATYTGDDAHCIVGSVIAIPEDEALWSARLRIYLEAAHQHHTRPKSTELGELLVTNLSSFPSVFTVIPVPEGDVRKHSQLFVVNEDLKRLGCSGRSGLTLTDPTEATQVKFHQLYKTSNRIPFVQSVSELVKQCQVALYMFEKLDVEYIDGLLCDVTETAIADWWTEVGAEHYNFEPTDGILGSSTVAALLGMLMGARNRLHWYGAPVSKDVFDMENTKRGVAYFQKQQKLDRTRLLDRQTLFRLHTATAKAASGEGWGVQKAVKSTVSEIGGKRGEIFMDMVSGRDKGGLVDIETLDIDRFVSFAYGERAKWLWHGKPRRSPTEHTDYDQEMEGPIPIRHDAVGQLARRTESLPLDEELETRREDGPSPYSTFPPVPGSGMEEHAGKRDALRNVFKSVAGKMNDARSGLGRIKDAVGGSRRGHASRPSASAKEDFWDNRSTGTVPTRTAQNMISNPAVVARAYPPKGTPEDDHGGAKRGDGDVFPPSFNDWRDTSASVSDSKAAKKSTDDKANPAYLESTLGNIDTEIRKDMLPLAFSRARHVAYESDLQGPFLDAERQSDGRQLAASRRHSCGASDLAHEHVIDENRWARRMSFGDAEPAILTWTEIMDLTDATGDMEPLGAHAEEAEHLGRLVDEIVRDVEPWVEDKVRLVESLKEGYLRDSSELQSLYHQLDEACQRVRHNSDELLAVERRGLAERIKEIKMLLGRLEYEMDSLAQRVHDVEDGIENFERQVDGVEKRAGELKEQLETESWLHWFVRTLTGMGTGPNITRAAS